MAFFYNAAPLVPADLSAVIGENRTLLSVSWGPSSSQQDYCQLWLREPGNSTLPQRHTLAQGQVQHVFWGLVPGRNYSVSLSCEAGPYWSSTGVLVVPVGGCGLSRSRSLRVLESKAHLCRAGAETHGDLVAAGSQSAVMGSVMPCCFQWRDLLLEDRAGA